MLCAHWLGTDGINVVNLRPTEKIHPSHEHMKSVLYSRNQVRSPSHSIFILRVSTRMTKFFQLQVIQEMALSVCGPAVVLSGERL